MGRARVDLRLRNDFPILFDYPYYLASALYQKIGYSNPDLSKTVHDKVKYKPFTFSWLDIPNRELLKNGIRILDGKANFQISSPSADIIRGFVEGLLSQPEIRLGRVIFEVEKVQVLPDRKIDEAATFRCLSPILVRTIKEADGKKTVWDLGPQEAKFFTNLRSNLIKRYNDFSGETSISNFEVARYYNVKRTRVRIKDTFNRAYFMELHALGNSDLLTFAYDAGLGERNSMGFGMVETV